MENEIWKDVPGYAGIYQVSNYGRVKSLPKSYIICNKYVVTAKEKVLKQRKVKGYKIIELNHKGIARRFPVHVLVAKMFIPNPNNYPEQTIQTRIGQIINFQICVGVHIL